MSRHPSLEGALKALPVIVSTTPFALLFGAVAISNGLTVGEAALMSASLYAGASQLVGIELFGHSVPMWIIILSVLAVNFRHVLYSAAVAPYVNHFTGPQKLLAFFWLTDPQFAETLARGESGKPVPFSWYAGFALAMYIPWIITSSIGAFLGRMMGDPSYWGIDVLLPIYFLGLVLGFRKRRNFLVVACVSAVASVGAWHLVGSPWHISIGALAGVILAAFLPITTVTPSGEQAA